MKIVYRNVQPDGPGSVKMIPEVSDDLWVAYNLIMVGDSVKATTVRKVIRQSASGNKDSERVKLTLEVDVQATEYDKEGLALRVQGKNIMENHYDIKIGAFHTLELDLHRPFVLRKDFWDELAREALREASDPSASADLAVLLMQEGSAKIYLVGKNITVCCGKGVTVPIPRKYGPLAVAAYGNAISSFFEDVLAYFLKSINFDVVKCVVIASPGVTKEHFHRYLLLEAERENIRPILENKARIVEARATSGYKHSLREVLDSPTVMNEIKDTKAAKEVRALKQFFSMMNNDPDRACYGPMHVDFARERLAVQTLLITDHLFRNPDIAARRKYSDLVKSVREVGGDVHIFSTMHVSGEQLQQITGVAAILRYPLPELDDLEM